MITQIQNKKSGNLLIKQIKVQTKIDKSFNQKNQRKSVIEEPNIEEEEVLATEDVVEVKTQNRFQKIIETVLRFFGIAEWISYAQVMHNFLFVVAIVGIGVLEIFNTHLAVKLNRSITEKENNIKELRWEFMTEKTIMNQKSKQSELQKIVEPYGLKSLQEAPKKIEVKKGSLKD